MERLIEFLREKVPKVFESELYQDRKREVVERVRAQEKGIYREFEKKIQEARARIEELNKAISQAQLELNDVSNYSYGPRRVGIQKFIADSQKEIAAQNQAIADLQDQARREGLVVDDRRLARDLGVPVVPLAARYREGLELLLATLSDVANGTIVCRGHRVENEPPELKRAVQELCAQLDQVFPGLPTTLLNDGHVLVMAGAKQSGSSGPDDRVEIFDPATNHWQAAAHHENTEGCHTATRLLDGRVLIAGGNTDPAIYDPVSDTWRSAGRLAAARGEAQASLLPDGRVLLGGGIDPRRTTVFDSVEIYDPVKLLAAGRADDSAALWTHCDSTP